MSLIMAEGGSGSSYDTETEENLIVLLQTANTADTSIMLASLEQNLRFAIELFLFFTNIQILGLSQLGLIIEPPLHLRPLIFPPERHGS
jgi:hypothetical protein